MCFCLSRSTFVHSVKTSTHILGHFSLSGRLIILVFPSKREVNIPTEPPPQWGPQMHWWGRQKSQFWVYIWLLCLLLTLQQARCCQHGRQWTTATVPQVMTLISLVIYCGYAGIRPLSDTRDNQSPSPWFYSARPTKRALALYTITIDRELCV